MSPNSRVWIYQSDREFTENEINGLKNEIKEFAQQWISHNQQLKAYGDLFYNRFLVLIVDETFAGASGCSIDKSVHFMQNLERKYGITLFDRLSFAYKDGETIRVAPKARFKELYQKGIILDNTLVFDNLVDNKSDFDRNWIKPLKESWHFRMVQ